MFFRIALTNAKPWDGQYDLEPPFTTREWGWIKRLTGYLPGTLEDGVAGDDQEIALVLAVIALHRAGRAEVREVPQLFDRLSDTFARIQLEAVGVEEDDAGPPAPKPNESSNSSGEESNGNWETWAETLDSSGIPASDTSASDPTRSVT